MQGDAFRYRVCMCACARVKQDNNHLTTVKASIKKDRKPLYESKVFVGRRFPF